MQQAFSDRAQAIASFDPELVIAFGSDHFNGFFLKIMPAFCIGIGAEACNDIGGFAGTLDVPDKLALECVEYLRAHDIDSAVSHKMTVDHAFSQTIQIALGDLRARPLIPVFINCITESFVPFRRSRLMGRHLVNLPCI